MGQINDHEAALLRHLADKFQLWVAEYADFKDINKSLIHFLSIDGVTQTINTYHTFCLFAELLYREYSYPIKNPPCNEIAFYLLTGKLLSSIEMRDSMSHMTSYLSPHELINSLTLVNKAFYEYITTNGILWKNKMEKHFPDNIVKPNGYNLHHWPNLFRTTYQRKYSGLSSTNKKYFSLVKEGNLKLIKQEPINHNEFPYFIYDVDGVSLLGIITSHKNPAIKNYFYELVHCKRQSDLGDNYIMAKDKHDNTLLHWAAALNQVDPLREMLLNSPQGTINVTNSDNSTPLYLACLYGNLETCTMLLEQGADIHLNHPIYIASQGGYANIVDVLIKAGTRFDGPLFSGYSPLYIAARNNRLAVAERLLEEQAINVNHNEGDGSTPLYVASQNGHAKMCHLLLTHGADPKLEFSKGYPPFNIASHNGHLEVIRVLSPYAYNGSTALSIACQNGHYDIVVFLLSQNVNLDTTFEGGFTLLHIVARNNPTHAINIINALLTKGANPLITDNEGKTAVDVAINTDIKNILLEHQEKKMVFGSSIQKSEEQSVIKPTLKEDKKRTLSDIESETSERPNKNPKASNFFHPPRPTQQQQQEDDKMEVNNPFS